MHYEISIPKGSSRRLTYIPIEIKKNSPTSKTTFKHQNAISHSQERTRETKTNVRKPRKPVT